MAKEYHPDINKGNKQKEDRFKDISLAYDVLSDPKKREQYDMMGHNAFQETGGQGAPDIEELLRQFGFGGNAQGGFGNEDRFNFGDLFGFGQSRNSDSRGSDIQVTF